jgi:hypothetical protein
MDTWRDASVMRECGFTSMVVYIDDKNHDFKERNVTTRSEIDL